LTRVGATVLGLGLLVSAMAGSAGADTRNGGSGDDATGGGAGPTSIWAYAVTTDSVRVTDNGGTPGKPSRRVVCYWYDVRRVNIDIFAEHPEVYAVKVRNLIVGNQYLLQCGYDDDRKEDVSRFFNTFLVNWIRFYDPGDEPDLTDINDVITTVRGERSDLFFEPETATSPEGVEVPVGVELWVWLPEEQLVDVGPVTAEAGPLWSQTGATFDHVEWVVYDGDTEVDRFECDDMLAYDPDVAYDQQHELPHCAIVFDDEPESADVFTIEPELHYEVWLKWGQIPATPATTAPVVDIADFVPAVGGALDVPVEEIQAVIRFGAPG